MILVGRLTWAAIERLTWWTVELVRAICAVVDAVAHDAIAHALFVSARELAVCALAIRRVVDCKPVRESWNKQRNNIDIKLKTRWFGNCRRPRIEGENSPSS